MGPKTMFDDLKEAAASGRYKSRFNADLYRHVRDGLCDNTANRILDAALDVCGSPHFAGAERRLYILTAALALASPPAGSVATSAVNARGEGRLQAARPVPLVETSTCGVHFCTLER